MAKRIPEEDMKLINESFKKTGSVETFEKNGYGKIVEAKKKVVNDKTITLQNFSGRILRHQKSLVVRGRGTIVIGVRGQKYDDILPDNRKLVVWFEEDFEKNGGIKNVN